MDPQQLAGTLTKPTPSFEFPSVLAQLVRSDLESPSSGETSLLLDSPFEVSFDRGRELAHSGLDAILARFGALGSALFRARFGASS